MNHKETYTFKTFFCITCKHVDLVYEIDYK